MKHNYHLALLRTPYLSNETIKENKIFTKLSKRNLFNVFIFQILYNLVPFLLPDAEHAGVQGWTGLLLHLHLHQDGYSQVL
jgi:hypothetical protein